METFLGAFSLKKERKKKSVEDERTIPKDVPKGHMVVYVGGEQKRFVIRISFLQHPSIQALLARAQDEYEFRPGSRLCIPCDETIFIAILRQVNSQHGRKIFFV